MVWMIRVSNWPALPTNGSPWVSSSAPGASPMNMSCALMSPTPKTTFLRAATRLGHLTHAVARWRSSAKAAALASGLSAGAAAGVGVRVGQCVSPAPPGGVPAEDRAGETPCPTLGVMGGRWRRGGTAGARGDTGLPQRRRSLGRKRNKAGAAGLEFLQVLNDPVEQLMICNGH